VQLGDLPEVDGKGELDLLALAQAKAGGADEDAGRAEVHGLADLAATARQDDVDNRARAMSGVQSPFHRDP
jgi:hypothetical protein